MKNLFLFLAVIFMLPLSGFAQNSIQLNIHHKLGTADFAMNSSAVNNLNNNFKVTRLEYYISEISIVHDGGTETAIEDLWVLVDASESTQIDLGSYNITEVEGINLHIGVDPAHNHLDPASYQNGHPLAPQFPSMHWGWSAGYRFVALEGKGGTNLNQTYQLHGLGDNNYFKTGVILSASAENNVIAINLDADYTRALENISVNSGLIVHGDFDEAKQTLENFRDFVFSPSGTTTSTVDFREINRFDVFPNPSYGSATLRVSTLGDFNYEVMVTDMLGRQVQHIDAIRSNETIYLNLENTGMYFISLVKEGQAVMTTKVVRK